MNAIKGEKNGKKGGERKRKIEGMRESERVGT